MRHQKWLDLLLFCFLLVGLGQGGLGNGEDRTQGGFEPIKGGFVTHAWHDTTDSPRGLQ